VVERVPADAEHFLRPVKGGAHDGFGDEVDALAATGPRARAGPVGARGDAGIVGRRLLRHPVPSGGRADRRATARDGDGGALLCLSHRDTARNEVGDLVTLYDGMQVTAFDDDIDENGNKDDLIANGVVIESPERLRCLGSKWLLRSMSSASIMSLT